MIPERYSIAWVDRSITAACSQATFARRFASTLRRRSAKFVGSGSNETTLPVGPTRCPSRTVR
jgi:hypothetical protein